MSDDEEQGEFVEVVSKRSRKQENANSKRSLRAPHNPKSAEGLKR